jgi:hypothetical protein
MTKDYKIENGNLKVIEINEKVIKNRFTSYKLSKKLYYTNCEKILGDTSSLMFISEIDKKYTTADEYYDFLDYVANTADCPHKIEQFYPAYDIIWDICIRYAKEFFDETWKLHTKNIFCLIQNNEKQKAEEYIWEHTIFNKENKK